MTKVCILGCRELAMLFRFPEDEPRRQLWFKAINMEYTITGKFLCGRHFSTQQYSKKLLKKQAVPDINLHTNEDSTTKVTTASSCTDDTLKESSAETIATENQCSVLLLTDEQMKTYVGPDKSIKYVKDGNTVRLLKQPVRISNVQHKAPKATLEMMFTTKEFQKIQELPKLPTVKNNNTSTANFMLNEKAETTATAVKTTTLLCSTDWKTQAEILRKKVEEKIKARNCFGDKSQEAASCASTSPQSITSRNPIKIVKDVQSAVCKMKLTPYNHNNNNLVEQKNTEKTNLEILPVKVLEQTAAPTKKLPTLKNQMLITNKGFNATTTTKFEIIGKLPCNVPTSAQPQPQQPRLPVKLFKPIIYLNRANVPTESSSESCDKTRKIESANILKESTNLTYRTVASQTSSFSVTQKTMASQTDWENFQACALVQRSTDLHTSSCDKYFLACFYCAKKFELADWDQFTFHYENSHKIEIKKKIFKKKEKEKRPLLPPISSSGETMPEDTATAMVTDEVVTADSETSRHFEEDYYNDEEQSSSKSMKAQNQEDIPKAAVINFYETERENILNFLEILKSQPILWHPRRCGPKIIDNEAQMFLKNLASNFSMSVKDLHCSLDNARKFQQRFCPLNDTKKLQLKNEPWLLDYVEQVDEIATLAKPYTIACELCEQYFIDENYLYKHKFLKHQIGDVTHICICGEYFAKIADKIAHENQSHAKPQHKCTHCELMFFSDRKLQSHIAISHTEEVLVSKLLYQCKKCDKKFAKQSHLHEHRLKHEPPRYTCEICGRGFHKSFPYKVHVKKHLDQRDFICEDCGKAFHTTTDLKQHRGSVHKVGDYYCEHCKTFYASFENLTMHNQKIHPNGSNLDHKKRKHAATLRRYYHRVKAARPCGPGRKSCEWKCKQCGAYFERMRGLLQHKRDYGHTLGDQPYKCPHCSSILNSKLSFLTHLRKQHQLPVKYSDIKYYSRLDATSVACHNEIIEKAETDQYDNVIVYEEVDEAVQNLNVDDAHMINAEYFEEFPKIEA